MKKILVITGSCVILTCVVACLIVGMGVRHDHRKPNQHWDQYWAVRELDVWSVFGVEICANNRLAVYDMTDRDTNNLPRPLNKPSVQVRRFGKIIEGDGQFNLGEDNYQRDECLAYIRDTLRDSGIEP